MFPPVTYSLTAALFSAVLAVQGEVGKKSPSGRILSVFRQKSDGAPSVTFRLGLCYADLIKRIGGIFMKQAVIYAMSERGIFARQIVACRLYAAQSAYRIVCAIRDNSLVPNLQRILRRSASAGIVTTLSVLGENLFPIT